MKRLNSVGVKLSLLTSLFVLGVISLMARGIFRQISDSLTSEMRLRADFFARSCREALFPKIDEFALHFQVKELLKEKAVVYAAVLDPDGKVLSHSDARRVGDKDLSPQGQAALKATAPLLQRFADPATGKETFDISIPVMVVSKRVGTVRLGFNQDSLSEALRQPKRDVLLLAVGAIALAVLGTVLITRWIMRPLPILAAAARQVGEGNFNVSVEWRSGDEIGALARAFNDMTVANSLLFRSLREEKEKIESVFNRTREGIIWTDTAGRILLMNRSAQDLLGFAERPPEDLETALRGFQAKPSLDRILNTSRRITPCEFHRSAPQRFILSGIADRLGDANQVSTVLFVFHDATLEKQEEHLARNFLSLVSHKLRTPLMVVLGYADILLKDYGKYNDFHLHGLHKIKGETDELAMLVESLLKFTSVQSPELILLKPGPLRLLDCLEAALASLSAQINDRDAKIALDPEAFGRLPRVRADRKLIDDVLKNLINNAIKFNPREDPEVRVQAELQGDFVRLTVSDNGPGIPAEEQPRLFKKFYQIDPDFTGQVLGMGLGLAFVKNVVQAHGGEVGLRSEVGRGSEFYFTLPVAGEES